MHPFAKLCLLALMSTATCLYGREAVESNVNAFPDTPHASKTVASPAHNTTIAPTAEYQTSNTVAPYQGSGAVVPYRPHQPVQVNTKIPGKMRGLKTAVSADRKKRYTAILQKSQNTWNNGDDNAYIAFWNTLTKDKRQLVKSNAKNFHKGTAYLAFINKLPLKGEAMLVSKSALQPNRATAGAAALPAIDSGGGHKGPGAEQTALCEAWKSEPNKAEKIKEIRETDPAKFQALKKCH
jgi:hypothetical protein